MFLSDSPLRNGVLKVLVLFLSGLRHGTIVDCTELFKEENDRYIDFKSSMFFLKDIFRIVLSPNLPKEYFQFNLQRTEQRKNNQILEKLLIPLKQSLSFFFPIPVSLGLEK